MQSIALSRLRPFVLAWATLLLALPAMATPTDPASPAPLAGPAGPAVPPWAKALQRELERVAAHSTAAFGVQVRDLDTGQAFSFHGDERWYLASSIKVPVAIAVLRGVERGDYTLDTALTLRATDYVDGAGPAKNQPVGAPLSVRWLLEQMMVYSDNTASDMLIDLVGLREINALVQSAVPGGFERITHLADVRRQAYSQFTPQALHLSGRDFITLQQQRTEADVKATLARLLRVPTDTLRPVSLNEAYETYYASGLNSARLDAYAELLAQLVEGRLLEPRHTAYLLAVMERVKTGTHRIKAGLPSGARFAHKTGTQRARTCDSGLVTVPRLPKDKRIIVVACTRGELSTARSDRTLRQVGVALCQSGLLSDGKPHEPPCQTVPSRAASPSASTGAAGHPGPGGADAGVDDEP
ncbi:serine hydrolase [Acidovorax sp. SUPP3334]|uniref:serine hydrolase n=1 Tax=Acidovorax sp. SUPP3334 TaxID=2920881 RepID=UPI0023DE3435|nr:serine hydrolase [Acidovorax sp. SUPP3334]GKT25663.1 serine hydrolase [Acidovorax sp. SUPP3334]